MCCEYLTCLALLASSRAPLIFKLAPFLVVVCSLAFFSSVVAALEEVTVLARKPVNEAGESLHGFSSLLLVDQQPAPLGTVSALVEQLPGVGFSGQGGLFQTISVRGVSRHRVGNYYLDIPLTSQRRAGTAGSFIDTALVSTLELVRGPATTSYGSGNIGGLLRSSPNVAPGMEASLSWGGSSDENAQALRFAGQSGFVGMSHRGANNAETPDGVALNTGFEQYNLLLGGHRTLGNADYSLTSLVSHGEHIGKSNSQYPVERITNYPRERHWLAQISRLGEHGSESALFFHTQDLQTDVLRPGQRRNEVYSQSLDFGARQVFRRDRGSSPFEFGFEYQGRRNVDARETETDVESGSSRSQRLLQAEQDELATFIQGQWSGGPWQLSAGARLSALKQDAVGLSSSADNFVTGFAGGNWSVSEQSTLTAEVSRGARAANLSEKYFSGTTGRGQVLGNPRLAPENANSIDLGYSYQGPNIELEIHAYYMDLHDFIERLDITPQLTAFRNSEGARIQGTEFIANWHVMAGLILTTGGHYQDGETDGGEPLQDVAPSKVLLGASYQWNKWQAALSYQYRFEKSRAALGEQAVDNAQLLSGSISMDLGASVSMSFWGRNLLDDSYLVTTDDLSTNGEQRAIGVRFVWRN